MKTKNKRPDNANINVKVKLMGLWITLMFLYIYADIFSFYRPGYIDEVIAGFMGPLVVNQMTLISSSILMAIPALMVSACLFVKISIISWVNIVAGVLYTLVGIGNLIGEVWAYYLIYGIVEILITVSIVVTAFKWTKTKGDEKASE